MTRSATAADAAAERPKNDRRDGEANEALGMADLTPVILPQVAGARVWKAAEAGDRGGNAGVWGADFVVRFRIDWPAEKCVAVASMSRSLPRRWL